MTDGDAIYRFRLGETDASARWIGDEFVTLRDGRGRAIYEPAHLHQHVETLLPSANRVGQWQMALAMLRHGNPESWVILLLILSMLLFTVTGH